MTKRKFLEEMRKRLSQLPSEEISHQLSYYAELIDDMVEDGMSEEEATAKLGDVGEITDKILQETPFSKLVKSRIKPKKGWTALAVILVILGSPVWVPLLLSALVMLFSLYISMWAVIVAIFAVVLAIGVSGVALIVLSVMNLSFGMPLSLLLFGGALVCIGFCIIAFLGALAVAWGAVKATVVLGRWIKSLFIRRKGIQE